MQNFARVAASVFAATALAGCNRGAEADAGCPALAGNGVGVVDPWIREQPTAGGMTAAYFLLCNTGPADAALVAVATPAATLAEIHETRRDAAGVVSMARLEVLVTPSRGAVQLEPGAAHVMLFGVAEALPPGARVPLVLSFADGSTMTVEAEVRSAKAAAASH